MIISSNDKGLSYQFRLCYISSSHTRLIRERYIFITYFPAISGLIRCNTPMSVNGM